MEWGPCAVVLANDVYCGSIEPRYLSVTHVRCYGAIHRVCIANIGMDHGWWHSTISWKYSNWNFYVKTAITNSQWVRWAEPMLILHYSNIKHWFNAICVQSYALQYLLARQYDTSAILTILYSFQITKLTI